MWWRERATRRQALKGLALGLSLPALSACGFKPLYGERAVGQSAQAALETVRIVPIAERTGQLLYNRLRDRVNPRGKPAEPLYYLEVRLTERLDQVLLATDETATRVNLTVSANYDLKQASDAAVIFTGQSRSIVSYDIISSQFATFAAERDARERAAGDLSEQIATRLAVYFDGLDE